jgi:hypothetical protein
MARQCARLCAGNGARCRGVEAVGRIAARLSRGSCVAAAGTPRQVCEYRRRSGTRSGKHPCDARGECDDPVRSALAGPHVHLAQRRGRILRYPPDVLKFIAIPNPPTAADWADVAALVGPDQAPVAGVVVAFQVVHGSQDLVLAQPSTQEPAVFWAGGRRDRVGVRSRSFASYTHASTAVRAAGLQPAVAAPRGRRAARTMRPHRPPVTGPWDLGRPAAPGTSCGRCWRAPFATMICAWPSCGRRRDIPKFMVVRQRAGTAYSALWVTSMRWVAREGHVVLGCASRASQIRWNQPAETRPSRPETLLVRLSASSRDPRERTPNSARWSERGPQTG